MARAIASRLLHEPTLRLKRSSGEDDAYVYVSALRELFGLDARSAPLEDAGRARCDRCARRAGASARPVERPAEAGNARKPARARAGGAGRRRAGRRRDRRRQVERRRARRQGALRARGGAGGAGGRGGPGGPLGQGPARRPSRRRSGWSGCSAARIPSTPTWARRRRSTRCPRGLASAPPACAGAPSCLALRPDLEVVELHGNVDTRLRKLSEGEFDGIVLAAAGLRRLGREARDRLRLRARGADAAPRARDRWRSRRAATTPTPPPRRHRISDHDALVELTAERAAVATLEATCHTPVGICARLGGGRADDARVRGPAGRLGMGAGPGHGRPRAARRAGRGAGGADAGGRSAGRSSSERRPPRDRGPIRRRLSGRSRARRSGPDDRAGRGADRRAPTWSSTTA